MTHADESRELDDRDLLERIRGGDSDAVRVLVGRHQGVVYRFLLGFLRDEDEASDAAQDTFLKALDRLGTFRGDAAFRTWLLAIARNEALGRVRKQRRRREESFDTAVPLPDETPSPEEQYERTELDGRVREVLEELPEKQRLSVSLRLFDHLSFREIGEATGSSEGAARVNYHYGIGRLREMLEDDYGLG